LFIIYRGVGATGTSTVTVEACDDVTPSNTTTVPFMYRENTTLDTWGSWTAATASGWLTTAGTNAIFEVYVDAAELMEEGYEFVRLDMAEGTNSPVIGGILVQLVNPRFQPQTDSALS
jgi:hypothetical protein